MSVQTLPKPFAPACERNREPILAHLKTIFATTDRVLEIGSGTGQHAVFFAAHMPHLVWQPSDRLQNIEGIDRWREESALPNLAPPLVLDVDGDWQVARVPAIFTANTLHIMSWQQVEQFFAGITRHLAPPGDLVVYGPFNYGGSYTSESNAQFDVWLKEQSPHSAIRDFEAVDQLAENAGLKLIADHVMPANNRLLHWCKVQPLANTL